MTQNLDVHCVKSVQIRRFSGPYFLAFGLRYFVFGHFSRSVYKHISDLCKKASRKKTASAPITSYMSLPKRDQLINSFFKAQFNYCHLIWMCHSRGNIRNIHQLHKVTYEFYAIINSCHSMNYWKKISLYQFMSETSKL